MMLLPLWYILTSASMVTNLKATFSVQNNQQEWKSTRGCHTGTAVVSFGLTTETVVD